jgi:hypothetical protein
MNYDLCELILHKLASEATDLIPTRTEPERRNCVSAGHLQLVNDRRGFSEKAEAITAS